MNKYYVIKNRASSFEEYALFVADRINNNEYDEICWQLSHTDTITDASKFLYVGDAFNLMSVVGLNADDWDVVLYEETK